MTSLRQNTRFLGSGLERLADFIGITRPLHARQAFLTRCKVSRPAFLRPLVQKDICRLPGVVHVHLQPDPEPDGNRGRKPSAICHAGQCTKRGGVPA